MQNFLYRPAGAPALREDKIEGPGSSAGGHYHRALAFLPWHRDTPRALAHKHRQQAGKDPVTDLRRETITPFCLGLPFKTSTFIRYPPCHHNCVAFNYSEKSDARHLADGARLVPAEKVHKAAVT